MNKLNQYCKVTLGRTYTVYVQSKNPSKDMFISKIFPWVSEYVFPPFRHGNGGGISLAHKLPNPSLLTFVLASALHINRYSLLESNFLSYKYTFISVSALQ